MSEILTVEEIIAEAKKQCPEIPVETTDKIAELLNSDLLNELKPADITRISNDLLAIQLKESHEN